MRLSMEKGPGGEEEFLSASESETLEIAAGFAARLKPGDAVALQGPLGAGKTLFCRGILRGLGGRDEVASPTYALVHEYSATAPVYHLDLYRLRPGADWEEIGLDHYLGGSGICLIEWPERLPERLQSFAYRVELEPTGEASRRIRISSPPGAASK
jgi:tRNA threonylcarbamoyladenosine biosynthesis protein TsaE